MYKTGYLDARKWCYGDEGIDELVNEVVDNIDDSEDMDEDDLHDEIYNEAYEAMIANFESDDDFSIRELREIIDDDPDLQDRWESVYDRACEDLGV